MSKTIPSRRSRRLNLRAVGILAAVLVVAAAGVVVVRGVQQSLGRTAYLDEAKAQIEKGTRESTSLALSYLNRYLELNPDDLKAVSLKAKVLADSAADEAQIKEAIQVNTQFLARASEKDDQQDARRRLAKLHLKIPNDYDAAESVANDLIEKGASDAEAYRLRARARTIVGLRSKNPQAVSQAEADYLTAEKQDPGDVAAAEELAQLYRERLNDPASAAKVLDQLVAANANAPARHAAALLARSRHHLAVHDDTRARADVDQAVQDDPSNLAVQLAAAEQAVQRGDPATARRHLSAIAAESKDDVRVKIVQGMVDQAELRTEDAIEAWRSGLLQSGGTDLDLTWRLSLLLLQAGRVDDARTLVTQFRRLAPGEALEVRGQFLESLVLLKGNHPSEAAALLEKYRFQIDKAIEPDLYSALGEAYEMMRNPARAAEAFQKASDLSQQSVFPWIGLARVKRSSHPDEAVEIIRKGLAINKDHPVLMAVLINYLVQDQLNKPAPQRNWTEVEELIARAKERVPGNPDVAKSEAEYLTAVGRIEDAVGLLASACALRPRSPSLWVHRVALLQRLNRVADASKVIDEAVAAAGPHAEFFELKALILDAKGQIAAANNMLLESVGKVPAERRPMIWKILADRYTYQGSFKDARAACQERIKLQPDNPEARLALAIVALRAGDEPEIEKAVEGLRSLGPDNYYWRLTQVENLLRDRNGETPDPARDQARLDQAAKLVEEIRARDPQLPLGYLLAGRLAEKRRDVDGAIKAYREALKLDAGQTALEPLINLLVREGRDADLQALKESLPRIPGLDVDRQASIQALKLGQTGRAEQLAEMVVKGDPQGLDARLWQSEVLKQLGKPQDAEKALRAAVAQRPQDPTAWISLIIFQLGQRDRPGAAATIEQMKTRAKPPFPELFWAQCYRLAGDVKNAAENFRLARTRWPENLGVAAAAVTFYESIGRIDEAEQTLRQVLARDPENASASRTLALLRSGRPNNRAAWDEAIGLIGPEPRPNDVFEDVLARANVYSKGPDPEHLKKAISIVQGMLNEMPSHALLHEQLARLLARTGDLKGAREHAEKAATADRPTAAAIVTYAEILVALKELDAADAQAARLAAVDVDGFSTSLLKSKLLAARGKAPEAAQVLEEAFDKRAAEGDASAVGEGVYPLLMSLNQPAAAERVLRKMAAGAAKYKTTLAQLIAGRQPDEAAKLLQEAVAAGDDATASAVAVQLAAASRGDKRWIDLADRLVSDLAKKRPDSYEVLELVALLKHFQKDYESEITAYNAMIAGKPANYAFLNNMAWTLSENMNRPEDGLRRANQAVERAGAQPNVLDTRGVILTRLGKYDEAVRDLQTAADATKSGVTYYHLARAYLKKGDMDEYRKARDLARQAGAAKDQLQPTEQADWDEVMKP